MDALEIHFEGSIGFPDFEQTVYAKVIRMSVSLVSTLPFVILEYISSALYV